MQVALLCTLCVVLLELGCKVSETKVVSLPTVSGTYNDLTNSFVSVTATTWGTGFAGFGSIIQTQGNILHTWRGTWPVFTIAKRQGLAFVFTPELTLVDGTFRDPPVLASVVLKMSVTEVVGSPRLRAVMPTEHIFPVDGGWDPAPSFEGAHMPGPAPVPYNEASEPWEQLPIQFITPFGLADSFEFTQAHVGTVVNIPMDPRRFREAMKDNSTGNDPWENQWLFTLYLEDEFTTLNSSSPPRGIGDVDASVTYEDHLSNSPLVLEVGYTDFHTGMMSWRRDRSRGVVDGRLGKFEHSSDLVEDKYTKGLYVHPSDQDPEDEQTKPPPTRRWSQDE